MAGLLGILIPFLIVLVVIVFVHEMGHYLVARWNDVAIESFSIGFGPELVGWNDKHGTRWKISAVPLGGYVKFVGDMNAASAPDSESLEHIPPEERSRLFYYKNVWQRIAIVAAGPAANILFTFVILYGMLLGLGRYTIEARIDGISPDTPAAQSELMVDDVILAVDGYQVRSFADAQKIISTSPNRELPFLVERNGRQVEVPVTTGSRMQEDRLGNMAEIGFLGISRDATRQDVRFVRPGPIEAIGITFEEIVFIIDRSFRFLGDLLVGRGDVEQLGGPVKIAKISGEAATLGIFSLISLTALLSLNIGIFNLFPIPLLDGGHLVYYAIEAVRGRPLSREIQEIGFRIGLFVVMSLMVFTLVNDIF